MYLYIQFFHLLLIPFYIFSYGKHFIGRIINDYYFGADGTMLKDEWIVDKVGITPNLIAYFVGADGSWDRGAIYTGCEGMGKEEYITIFFVHYSKLAHL